jgi:hypothetical protein
MLTRTMPSVMRALQGSLDSQTLKAFTQALGNCNQSLEHRGDIAAQPNNLFIRQGEYGGDTYNSGYSSNNFTQYNPTFQNFFAPNFPPFNPIFPPPFSPDPILPPVISPGDTNISIGGDINNTFNNNNYNSNFYFPTSNFFGGPTNNFFGGNTTINNSTTNNAYTTNNNTTNFYVTNINGRPIAGPSGPPGQPGRDGRDGRDGAPGAPGASLPPVGGIILPPNVPPPPAEDYPRVTIDYISKLPNYDGKLREFQFQVPVKKYSFDDSTCTLSESTAYETITVPEQTVTITADEDVQPNTVTVLGPRPGGGGQ